MPKITKPLKQKNMKLDFQKIEEANDLLNQLIEHHPQAIFLTDNNFKVKYFNKAFQKLTKSDKGDILEHEFCEIMGCTERGNIVTRNDNFCKICQMRELLSGSNLSELSLIRDFNIHNKMVTKHLHIDAHRVVMSGHKYRLVVIEDRTQKH
ncbi:PAS domain-containing protein [Mariniphaga sediminis]|uniref:PAS domain-containing protein n=2 Tax=Mariniphaga sediminis TaxID=1628158 RepID=A0A399D488_9BACT|nr:PAS domain-containing protein [Mariniphaga sediminis]